MNFFDNFIENFFCNSLRNRISYSHGHFCIILSFFFSQEFLQQIFTISNSFSICLTICFRVLKEFLQQWNWDFSALSMKTFSAISLGVDWTIVNHFLRKFLLLKKLIQNLLWNDLAFLLRFSSTISYTLLFKNSFVIFVTFFTISSPNLSEISPTMWACYRTWFKTLSFSWNWINSNSNELQSTLQKIPFQTFVPCAV